MSSSDWTQRCERLLQTRSKKSLLRRRQIITPIDSTHVLIGGTSFINFSSNDYLGLTHHPRLRQAGEAALREYGSGSAAAALICGYTSLHAQAEEAIAQWKGTQTATLLPSGYQANFTVVQTLSAIGQSYPAGTRFLVDKLAHASIVDAVRATSSAPGAGRWPMRVFPHNDLGKLKRLLGGADPSEQLQVVVTESIFSMDGDAADLAGLVELKQTQPFVLVLDEAHGSGVYGLAGAGLAAELGLKDAIDISVVTLSKALGCIGAAVCCSSAFRDALVNFARAYIYSTSVPAMVAASAMEAIGILKDEPQRQSRVRELARRVRRELSGANLQIPVGDSPIIPVVLGSEQAALEAAEKLKSEGLLTIAVRPPTVPAGSSRLRVTLSCNHAEHEIDKLLKRMKNLRA